MLSANFQNQQSSRAYNINNIQQASILIWRNKFKQSMIMPMLIMKPQIELTYKKNQQQIHNQGQNLLQKQASKKGQNVQQIEKHNFFIKWNQIANILLQQGPLNNFQLLVQNYCSPVQKMKFRVNINDKEKLIISANWNQNVGEVCDKILISFFSTFVYQEQQFKGNLQIEDLPAYINKVKINNKVVQMKDLIGRVAHENDLICVSLSKMIQINSESQKKILRKLEEYNQRKAKELKEKQKGKMDTPIMNPINGSQLRDEKNNNQSSISILDATENSMNLESNTEDRVSKKQKYDDSINLQDQDNSLVQIRCRIILGFQKVYVDIWDPQEEENVQFSLSQEESIEDLKWLVENYFDVEQERIQLICQVYVHKRLFEFDQVDVNYELFNKKTSTLNFFNRLYGG